MMRSIGVGSGNMIRLAASPMCSLEVVTNIFRHRPELQSCKWSKVLGHRGFAVTSITSSGAALTNEHDMPVAFVDADKFSLRGQQQIIHGTSFRLLLTVVATVCLAVAPLWPTETGEGHGDHHEIEVGALVAAGLFLIALLVELWLIYRRPEREWYDGRAVAESTKTLAWRYAVGGLPYAINRREASRLFVEDIKTLGTDVASLRTALTTGGQPTAWMRSVRTLSLSERRDIYLRERIRNQEEWYARKASYNRRRATFWNVTLLIAEALAVVLALLKGVALVPIDLASVAAAVIASGVAWLAVKQHESIAAAYALASRELGSVHVRLLAVDDEETWADEVASAEEAVSREHTMWRASRSMPEPPPSAITSRLE